MTEILEVFNKLVEYFGKDMALYLVIAAIALYGIHFLLKTYSGTLQKLANNWIDEKNKKHSDGAKHRKNVSPKIRAELMDLAKEIKADRALVFEYSNGTSNLVGLPFLYISATYEVTTPGTSTVSLNYQKVNAALIAEFLEDLEDKGYYYVHNVECIKNNYPVVYSMMKPNDVRSAIFYTLYGVNNTIGFVVATTVKDKEFTSDDALPEIAGTAQIISSLLNFDAIQEKL